jgi:hypothetical protein
LSLTEGGSLTHAAFGGESAGGDGTPVFEVCQRIPSGSIAFVAVHPAGSIGGVTPSKFSANTVMSSAPGGQGGVAGVTAAKVPRRAPCALEVREGPIATTATMPAAAKKSKQRTGRTRRSVNLPRGLVIIDRLVSIGFLQLRAGD